MADTDTPAPSCPACSPDQASDATPDAEVQAMLAHHPGLFSQLAHVATRADADVLKRMIRQREQRDL